MQHLQAKGIFFISLNAKIQFFLTATINIIHFSPPCTFISISTFLHVFLGYGNLGAGLGAGGLGAGGLGAGGQGAGGLGAGGVGAGGMW